MKKAMKLFRLTAVCMFLILPMYAQDASKPFSLEVNVDLVEVHVTVVDGKQRPVGGLTRDHFKITENRVEQPIAVFKQEDVPLSLGLVIDNSRSIEPRKGRLDAAAVSFVKKSNPEDETFVVHFDFEARLSQNFSQDAHMVERTLTSAQPYGQTAIFDALFLALDTMQKAKYEKKALLLITDGIDNRSVNTLADVVARLKRERVAVYVVGLLSRSGGLKAEDALIDIAEASGGRAYFPENNEEARIMMERIARDLREQYTLGYFPTNSVRDGEWRSVRVEITPPQGLPSALDVSYRRGYFAPTPNFNDR